MSSIRLRTRLHNGNEREVWQVSAKGHDGRWLKRDVPVTTKVKVDADGRPIPSREAKDALTTLIQDIGSGIYDKPSEPPKADVTVETYAKQWLKACELYDRVNTLDNKRSQMTHVIKCLGSKKLKDIGKADVEAFSRYLLANKPVGAGLQVSSANTMLNSFRAMHRAAVDEGLCAAVKVRSIRDDDDGEPEFWNFEEADKALRYIDPDWQTQVLFALRTGLRPGEHLALKWSELDLVAPVVKVRATRSRKRIGEPKTKRSKRDVPLTPAVVEELKKLPRNGDFVFHDEKGKPRELWQLATALDDAAEAGKVKRLTPHGLRHTFASHLVMKGVAIEVVSKLMGHTNLQQTMRYAHLAPKSKASAVAVLDAA